MAHLEIFGVLVLYLCIAGLAASACSCLNGGTCMTTQTLGSGSGEGLDICSCPPNFTGSNCESCTETDCLPGYELVNCLCTPVHICVIDDPCMNGGTCELGPMNTEFSCFCTVGFTGATCNEAVAGDDACSMWQDEQNQPQFWYTDLPPCPCVVWQALWDWRFFFLFSGGIGSRCFVDMTGGPAAPTTECCYDGSGALLVGAPNGGGYRLHHPLFLRSKYEEDTITPRQDCCSSGKCEVFYNLRPSDDCSRYRPIRFSWMWGDPHFESVDGNMFAFNGIGEYTLLKSSLHNLVIQARLTQFQDVNASVITAVAMKNGNSLPVQIEVNTSSTDDDRMLLFIDKVQYSIPSETLVVTNTTVYNQTQINNGADVGNAADTITLRNVDDSLLLTTPSQANFRVSLTNTTEANFLYSSLQLGSPFFEATEGLLGTFNGDSSDDYMTPDKHNLSCTTSSCIHDFGLSWKLEFGNESLFFYQEGDSFEMHKNQTITPVLDVPMNSSVVAACGGDFSCIFDATVTGNMEIGLASQKINQTSQQIKADLENFPPNITGLQRIMVQLNESTKSQYLVTDDTDDRSNIKLSLNDEAASKESVKLNSTTGALDINLSSLPDFPIFLIANDSSGRVTKRRISIILCACSNGGSCVEPEPSDVIPLDMMTGHYQLPCTCPNHTEGIYCSSDLNQCSTNTFPEFALCSRNNTAMNCSKCLASESNSNFVCVETACNFTAQTTESSMLVTTSLLSSTATLTPSSRLSDSMTVTPAAPVLSPSASAPVPSSPSPSLSLTPSPSPSQPPIHIAVFIIPGVVAGLCTTFAFVWWFVICVIRLKRHFEKKQKALGSWEEDNHFLWSDEQPDWGEQDVMEIKRLPPRHRVGYVPAKKDIFNEFTSPLTVEGLQVAISQESIGKLHSQFMEVPSNMLTTADFSAIANDKNRYKDVLPNPQTRVSLFLKFGVPHSDYINANYIRGYRKVIKYFIATQAPLPNTINDFWRMIWEQKSSIIIMLTNHEERGKVKCAHYWPGVHTGSWTTMYGDIEVTHVNTVTKADYKITKFQLKNSMHSGMKEVTHYWFTGWPDYGVPDSTNNFLNFTSEARTVISQQESAVVGLQAPAVVHCSSGISRTGVFIGALIGMKELEENSRVDLLSIVSAMRQDRGGMVQTKDQYVFLHKVLYDYALRIGRVQATRNNSAYYGRENYIH